MFEQHKESVQLSIQGLVKYFGKEKVVDELNLAIDSGQCVGVIGPNGAGKTTTIRCALGLTQRDAGEIRLVGLSIPKNASEARKKVGVVSQFDTLDPDFTVFENLKVFARYFKIDPVETERLAPELLESTGLIHKRNAKISELSGGMKRRLSLARALINQPKLLFLDEPTTGLDPQARQLIWEKIKQQSRQKGSAILLTTHFMEEAQRLCDRIVVLDHGKVLAEGRPQQLIREYIDEDVLEIFGRDAPQVHNDLAPLAQRYEHIGETFFYYSSDVQPILAKINNDFQLTVLQRKGNLEDVFIKLTGRQLRD